MVLNRNYELFQFLMVRLKGSQADTLSEKVLCNFNSLWFD